jgi:flagellar hook-associated protein 2
MSDIYMPGLRSRFNTDRMVDDLMRVERVPLERAQRETEQLQSQKTWWQDIGRRMTTLRDSARFLFSFQNPFSERVVHSADESVISGTATRQAMQQERSFQVGQLASADRFLSEPLEDNFRVDAGNYTFTVGNREVSFNFRGGSLREFTDVLNRRGRNTIQASVINIERNSRSLLVESLLTGEENRLGFKGDAERLATAAGMVERQSQTRYDVDLNNLRIPDESVQLVTAENGVIWVGAGGSVTVPFQQAVPDGAAWVLSFEAATEILSSENGTDPLPPPGPDIPSAG